MRRIALYLLILLPLTACSIQEKPVRTLEAVIPAAGITTLALGVNIGSVVVTPSTDSQVHVSVGLKPSNSFLGIFSMGGQDAIKEAVIKQTSSNGALKLSLQYPANTDASGVNEYWTLAVPVGMHISSDINVGKLQVSGVTGGVEANLNVGKVVLDLPSGPMKVSINVGKINAQAASLNYAQVTLGADVGDAQLLINGVSAGNLEKSSTGTHVNYRGHGQDAISLTVNTGKAALVLNGK
ncbi:MAG TPA: hypothetical protein VNI53_00580 [Gammaproteobacteria bacterium]|nr:hypothetical protein [Gammaproteobacteria bacterium]